MALAKWQQAKLEEILVKMKRGPSVPDFGPQSNEGFKERFDQHFKVWSETWIIPYLEEVISNLKPPY